MKKIIYMILGFLCLALGVIGIILPILPTTPLLLLCAFFFVRSSNKLYQWLLNNKLLGHYIYNYINYKAIPKRAKISAFILLWTGIILSTILIDKMIVYIILPSIALLVSIYIYRLKTLDNHIKH